MFLLSSGKVFWLPNASLQAASYQRILETLKKKCLTFWLNPSLGRSSPHGHFISAHRLSLVAYENFLWLLLGFITEVIHLWVANFCSWSPSFLHMWCNLGRLCSWTKCFTSLFYFYHISTTFIFTVCFTSAPSVSWSLVRYTMSRRKKNGRPLIVFEQIFANHVYPLCGSPHPPVYCSTRFSMVFQPGAKLVCFVAESIVMAPVVYFSLTSGAVTRDVRWCLQVPWWRHRLIPFLSFPSVHCDYQTRCVLLQAHCGCEEKASSLLFALLE